jgi:hypothetical protein
MRRFNKIVKGSMFISLILLMTSCVTEEIGQKNATQSTTEAKIWFDTHKSNYNTTILQYVNDLEWQNAIVSNGDLGQVIEVPFTLTSKLSTTNKDADLYNDHHRLMFIKENNEFKLFDVQIYTSKEKSKILDKDYNYYSIKDDFDGKVFVQELATNIVSKLDFENGNKIIPSLTSKQREAYIDCVAIGYWYEDGHFEPIGILYCEGGGGSEEPSPSGGYGGGGGISGSGSGTTSQTIVQKIIKNIKSDKLVGCPKEILEKLKTATNCDIANLLTKLGTTRTINLEILTEQPTDGQPAQTVRTNPLDKYQYTVRISPDYTSATSLFRASNILHEFTHAYFMSLIDDYTSTGNPVVFADTPTLFQAYCDKQFPPNPKELPNVHHAEMASTYVNAIASALQEFQTGIPVINGTPIDQIYTDLAWGGLRGTPIYNETFPEGSADAIRIKARYGAESNGGTSGNQTAIGKPCKI